MDRPFTQIILHTLPLIGKTFFRFQKDIPLFIRKFFSYSHLFNTISSEVINTINRARNIVEN